MGEYTTPLVAESFYQAEIAQVREGDAITLAHEPSNKFDSRAIQAITSNGQVIGYLKRESWLGRLIIDEGAKVTATIARVTGGGINQHKGIILTVRTGVHANN